MNGFDGTFDVLVAEHGEHDIVAVQRAWKAAGVDCRLTFVQDGAECLERLNEMAERGHAVVLLLDWRLPKLHGRDVLRTIRASPTLHRVPVVVMTSSKDALDLEEAYALGANAFIRKTVHGLSDAIKRTLEFWGSAYLPVLESAPSALRPV